MTSTSTCFVVLPKPPIVLVKYPPGTWYPPCCLVLGPFSEKKKNACGNVPRSWGLPKIWGAIFLKKKRLRQRAQKLRASKNMGAIFSGKKSACGNVPTSSGLVKNCPLGIQAEKQGFRTVRKITGQKFPWKNLKSGSSLLTFRGASSHICEIILWMAKSGILDPGSCSKIWIFSNTIFCGFLKK